MNLMRTHDLGPEQDTRRRLRTVAKATAVSGGPLFLLGVLLHPARDGAGIAAVGQTYGITHGLEAISLLLVAVSLVSIYVLDAERFGRSGVPAFLTAVVGTLLWFGLIAVDGTRNPVTARYAPDIVHTPADLDARAAIISLPALLLFPWAMCCWRCSPGTESSGRAAGGGRRGGVLDWSGAIPLFILGPKSPLSQILEVAGVVPFALGFVLLGRLWGKVSSSSITRPPAPTSRRASEVCCMQEDSGVAHDASMREADWPFKSSQIERAMRAHNFGLYGRA